MSYKYYDDLVVVSDEKNDPGTSKFPVRKEQGQPAVPNEPQIQLNRNKPIQNEPKRNWWVIPLIIVLIVAALIVGWLISRADTLPITAVSIRK